MDMNVGKMYDTLETIGVLGEVRFARNLSPDQLWGWSTPSENSQHDFEAKMVKAYDC